MLLDNDLSVYDIQDFCIETLKNSIVFSDFCVATIGSSLNFETDSRMDSQDALPVHPYCVAYAGEEQQDLRVSEWGHTYEIGFEFSILDDDIEFIVDSDIKKYQATRKLEKVAKKAIEVVKSQMRSSGISGDFELEIVSASGEKSPTGLANDAMYLLALTFAYLDDINK